MTDLTYYLAPQLINQIQLVNISFVTQSSLCVVL